MNAADCSEPVAIKLLAGAYLRDELQYPPDCVGDDVSTPV